MGTLVFRTGSVVALGRLNGCAFVSSSAHQERLFEYDADGDEHVNLAYGGAFPHLVPDNVGRAAPPGILPLS